MLPVRGANPVNSTCVLVATPDYPVAAGQTVQLQCSAEPLSPNASPSYVWQRLENDTWVAVSNGSDVTLAEPNQSGLYSCFDTRSRESVSQNHTVFIVAIPPTGWLCERLNSSCEQLELLDLIPSCSPD